eukprot:3257586-Heterocapsa_arctica.AAC.1
MEFRGHLLDNLPHHVEVLPCSGPRRKILPPDAAEDSVRVGRRLGGSGSSFGFFQTGARGVHPG